jgi:hypothetical protein
MPKTLEEIRAYNKAFIKEWRVRTGYEKKYYEANKEKKLAYARAQQNNEVYKKRKSELAKLRSYTQTEDQKNYCKELSAKHRKELSDGYIVSQVLRSFNKKFINADLIEVKRLQILIKRNLKNEKRI